MMLADSFRSARRHSFLLLLGAMLLLSAAPLGAQDKGIVSSSTELNASLWAEGVDKIVHGRFVEARDSLAQILRNRPGQEQYVEIASWLDRRKETNSSRSELHAKQRDLYLKRAKKSIEAEEWGKALAWSRWAMQSTHDEATFMREPWFQELHDKTVTQAEELKNKAEWAKASGLYYELSNAFEGHKEYENNMDECLARARLDIIYDEDSKWRTRLRGITPAIVNDAMWQIHRKYVADADFKKIALGGLDQVQLLADSDSLAKVFPSLKDQANRKQYIRRLERLARKIERLDQYSYRDIENDAFRLVLNINESTFELPREVIIYEFLEGALRSSNSVDQFTSMIWPSEFSEFEKHTQGHFKGVGIQISKPPDDKHLTVVTPLEDSPAYRAGIQEGDKLTHVDGESTEDLSLTDAVKVITGPVNTEVVLTVYRPSTDETFDVPLIREEIQIRSVKGYKRAEDPQKWDYMLDSDFRIGYIRVSSFASKTVADLGKALSEFESQGGQALILDLRFNPGGLLRGAIKVSEFFLPDDRMIVSTEGQHSEPFSTSSRSRNNHYKFPLVVMVNEYSASASEIVAGALKDHKRAIIVGERTFGKGSVQNLIPVGHSNGQLKLTTAHYYLPSGQCIHKVPESDTWGVEPDVIVKMVPEEVKKVRWMRREVDVIHAAGVTDSPGTASKDVGNDDKLAVKKSKEQDAPVGSGEDAARDSGAEKVQPLPEDAEQDQVADEGKNEEEEEPEEFVEYPDVDHQLETALLILRVQLLEKLGFGILPKVKLGEKDRLERTPAVAIN